MFTLESSLLLAVTEGLSRGEARIVTTVAENPCDGTEHPEERPLKSNGGSAVILMNFWILALTPVCAWVLHKFAILPEEAYLENKFGPAYLAYKDRVGRWL